MNGLVRNVLSAHGSTSPKGSARLTNFNPDKILFVVHDTSGTYAKTALNHFTMTMNFKNSVGSGIAITANLPFDLIADYSDFLYGFGFLANSQTACFVLDIGKYCLRADDEITFNLDCDTTFSDPFDIDIYALDTKIGKEQLISYKYVSAQASQAYQEANVSAVYASIAIPSASVYLTSDDFFGSNNLSELSVVGIGAALGQSEDFDSFGMVWSDDTGLTQPVTIRAGSSNERLLFRCWNFDVNRIGYERPEFNSAKLLAQSIQQGNPSKAKCLKYFYG